MCYNLYMSPAEILESKPSNSKHSNLHYDPSVGELIILMILAVITHIVMIALGLLFLRLLALLPS